MQGSISISSTHRTSSLVNAAVLVTLKQKLLRLDRANPRRVIFEFVKTPQLEKSLELLNKGELKVDPNDFWAAERRCKQLLYEEEQV